MSTAAQQLHDRVEHNLTNHTPDADGIFVIEELRKAAKQLGHLIVDACPEGREQSTALTKLEETVMFAVASVARSEQYAR